MQLKSMSASAVKTWQACPAMAAAQSINKPPQLSGFAAELGTACHAALEFWVMGAIVDKTIEPTVGNLELLYHEAYEAHFGSDATHYQDGLDMVRRWFERTAPQLADPNREVESCEVKENFPITSKAQGLEMPFNYIFDRVDKMWLVDREGNRTGKYEINVIDYKTWRFNRTHEAMKDDIQMRCYGLAGQIRYPEADRIWVTLDQLRFDAIGVVFTREQNIATWRFLQQKLVEMATAEEPYEERINTNCRFCIRNSVCATLNAHVDAGGVLAIKDPDEAAKALAEIQNKQNALKSMSEHLSEFLLTYAGENDLSEWETEDSKVQITASKRRGIDAQRFAQVVGPEVFSELGSITIGAIDALLKGQSQITLTPEQKRQIKALITPKFGNPSVKVTAKNPIDES